MVITILLLLSVVMLSFSRSTVDCNRTTFRPRRPLSETKLFYLTKTFVVKMYYCNLHCYVTCSTSLLKFEAVAMSLHHIIITLVFFSIVIGNKVLKCHVIIIDRSHCHGNVRLYAAPKSHRPKSALCI